MFKIKYLLTWFLSSLPGFCLVDDHSSLCPSLACIKGALRSLFLRALILLDEGLTLTEMKLLSHRS